MSVPVNIAAIVTGPAENAQEIEQALRRCIAPSRAEVACKRYIIARDCDHIGRFVLDEEWASKEGFEAHLTTVHFRHLTEMLEKFSAKIDVCTLKALEPLA